MIRVSAFVLVLCIIYVEINAVFFSERLYYSQVESALRCLTTVIIVVKNIIIEAIVGISVAHNNGVGGALHTHTHT